DRVEAASYCRIPRIELNVPDSDFSSVPAIQQLAVTREALAYIYATPHEIFGDPFLRFEHASLVVFTPTDIPVSALSKRPGTRRVGADGPRVPKTLRYAPGYDGRFNLKHFIRVARGSRIYPPVPNLGLNLSQSLASDLGLRHGHSDRTL